jgi:hypothetical protein
MAFKEKQEVESRMVGRYILQEYLSPPKSECKVRAQVL